MFLFITAFPLLLGLLQASQVPAETVQLDFTRTIETTVKPGKAVAVPEATPPGRPLGPHAVRLVLGGNRLVIEETGERILVDFPGRRYKVVDLARKQYMDLSLYSTPLFRSMELNNRNAMVRAFERAGVRGMPDWRPTLNQHELSIFDPSAPAEIRREETAACVSFFWKDKPLFEYQKECAPVSRAAMVLFAQYFRYGSCGTHPKILQELQTLPGIPKTMIHTAYYGGIATSPALRSRFVLDHVTAGKESSFSVAEFAPAPLPGLDDEAALMAIVRKDPRGAAAQVTRATQSFERAVASRRYFEATLAATELSLQTGDSSWERRVAAFADRVHRDPDVRRFHSSVVVDEAHLWQAILNLRSLRPKAGEFSHVLMLMEANLHAKRRSGPGLEHAFDDARELHLAALKVNPYNPSVWRDLGSTYQKAYLTPPACYCWDFARELAPDHPAVRELDAMQKQMEADMPEYFLTGVAAGRTEVSPGR